MMTAINVWTFPDKAYVMTDGLVSNTNPGLRKGLTNKAIPMPHMSAVLCVSGNLLVAGYVWMTVQQLIRTMDDAINDNGLGRILSEVVNQIKSQSSVDVTKSRVHLIGYSQQHQSFLNCMAPFGDPDAKDFEVNLLSGVQSPCPSLCDAEAQAAAARLLHAKPERIEADGIALMRGQARYDPVTIGEFVQMTVLDRRGISTRIVAKLP